MAAPNCPACGKMMKQRNGSRGPFWGCSGYPSCRRTLPFTSDEASTPETEAAPAEPATPRWELPKPPSYSEAEAAYVGAIERLDDDQRMIAGSVAGWKPSDGNLRVVAAAGSGKTSTTVALIARLIRESTLSPQQVVATTFTSKAGKELAERLNRVLPPGALPQMRVGTFHGLALKALRGAGGWDMAHCLDIGKRAAGIPSTGQLWAKVLGYAGEEGLPGTGAAGFGLEEPDVKAYSLAVDVARSHALQGAALEYALRTIERDEGLPFLASAWRAIFDVKCALGAWDFADALDAWRDQLRSGTPSLRTVVFVDEAQDNSQIQLEIAQLLSRTGALVLIGDTRQAIYSWRGAYPEFFRDADRIIGAKTLQLRNNYRSGSAIVAAGNRTAHGQDWAVGDAARAARDVTGTISTSGHVDPADEARAVVERIQAFAADGSELDDMAILCRTNAMSGAFEAACIQASVPCVVVGGKPFFQRYEVMNALAYVKLSYTDDLEAFARIVNKPRRYLGARFVAQVKDCLHSAGGLVAAVEAASRRVYKKQQDAAIELYAWLLELRAKAWPESLAMIVRLLTPANESDSGEADSDRSGLIAAVASLGRGFTSPEAFVEFAERCAGEVVEARAEDGGFVLPAGRVTISTIHKMKGLEAKHVFVSASKGTFPHARSASSTSRMAEELRLFYVAVTRAKDTLHASWSEVDLYGRPAGPSPFLDTLEDENAQEVVMREARMGDLRPAEDVDRLIADLADSATLKDQPPDGGGDGLSFGPGESGPLLALAKAAMSYVDGAAPEDNEAMAAAALEETSIENGRLVQRPFAGLAGRFDCSEPSVQDSPKAKPPRIRRRDKK